MPESGRYILPLFWTHFAGQWSTLAKTDILVSISLAIHPDSRWRKKPAIAPNPTLKCTFLCHRKRHQIPRTIAKCSKARSLVHLYNAFYPQKGTPLHIPVQGGFCFSLSLLVSSPFQTSSQSNRFDFIVCALPTVGQDTFVGVSALL